MIGANKLGSMLAGSVTLAVLVAVESRDIWDNGATGDCDEMERFVAARLVVKMVSWEARVNIAELLKRLKLKFNSKHGVSFEQDGLTFAGDFFKDKISRYSTFQILPSSA